MFSWLKNKLMLSKGAVRPAYPPLLVKVSSVESTDNIATCAEGVIGGCAVEHIPEPVISEGVVNLVKLFKAKNKNFTLLNSDEFHKGKHGCVSYRMLDNINDIEYSIEVLYNELTPFSVSISAYSKLLGYSPYCFTESEKLYILEECQYHKKGKLYDLINLRKSRVLNNFRCALLNLYKNKED